MEPTTKKAADRVNNHREDGEEAMKQTSKVVPIDSQKDSQSVQVTPDTKPQSKNPQSSRSYSRKD